MTQANKDLEQRLEDAGYTLVDFTSFAFQLPNPDFWDDGSWVVRVSRGDGAGWLHALGPSKRDCLLKVLDLIAQRGDDMQLPDDGFDRYKVQHQ